MNNWMADNLSWNQILTSRRFMTIVDFDGYAGLDLAAGLLDQAKRKVEGKFLGLANALMSTSRDSRGLFEALGHIPSIEPDRYALGAVDLEAEQVDPGVSVHELSCIAASVEEERQTMMEALRYLSSCAITLKVTGARHPEVANFAHEMIGTIARTNDALAFIDGSTSWRNAQPENMAEHIYKAKGRAETPSTDSRGTRFPLSADDSPDAYLASATENLQIGDITSQRLDHAIRALDGLEELAPWERGVILDLLTEQIEDAAKNYADKTKELVEHSLQGISAIDRLQEAWTRGSGEVSITPGYHALELEKLLADRQRSTDIHAYSQAVLDRLADLQDGVETLLVSATEIHYSALNTNLCCSRIGGDAISANTIAAEIRLHGGTIAGSAEAMDSLARRLRTAAERVLHHSAQEIAAFGATIAANEASERNRLEDDLARRSAVQNHLPQLIKGAAELRATASVDGEAQGTLNRAVSILRNVEDTFDCARCEPSDALLRYADGVFATYTMNREREIHEKFLRPPEDFSECATINLFGEDEVVSQAITLF